MKDIDYSNHAFSNVINYNFIYADKTKHVWELAKTESAYFLSRPRRFGKSLLLSTFAALFKGSPNPQQDPQGLFKNLWISGKEANYDFNDTYPVISLSMSVSNEAPEMVTRSVQGDLRSVAESYGLSLNEALFGQS